ncbi:MAG: succinylglutamate desuccinylase/aspartoacylase family protein [Myxococcota bacterium]|nr:succinylglutamate desuccinylase/aspartoacylase family protein [Myxococcota bacterium]
MKIGKEIIQVGERKRFQLEVASLYDYTQLTIPIEVICGKKEGPVLFISAAIHGDEINGLAIIKRLLKRPILNRLKGTLIVVPIVNVFGFNNRSRYLPDRRDLNRCFPGHQQGSLGSRLASIFTREIVNKCTHGIDLHTGAIHRYNLPQIRASLDDPQTKALAECFGAPVVIHSRIRDGSLRESARKKKVVTLLYEGGQALRFEEEIIEVGLSGCLSVMREIGMLPRSRTQRPKSAPAIQIAQSSYWVRAPHSGSFRLSKKIGEHVEAGALLATISNPFGHDPHDVRTKEPGVIIGLSKIPLVNRGDAMIHVATFKKSKRVKDSGDFFDQ